MNRAEKSSTLRTGFAGKEFFFQIVLTVGLFLSVAFVPLAGFFSGVFTPAPTALAVIRWGLPAAWIVPVFAAAAGSVILFFLDMYASIPYLLALLAVGAIIGHGLKNEWSIERIVLLAASAMMALAGVLLILALAESKGELVALLEQDLRETISATLKQFGSPSLESQVFENNLLESVPLIVRIIPGVLASCSIGVAWINLLVARKYCRAAALESCFRENLALWKAPDMLVWPVIAAGIMLLLPFDALRLYGINILIVLGTVYFLNGLAIVAYYFERWRVPLLVKGIIYAVLFLQQFASMATAALGLFDTWFDFRKLIKKPA